MASETTLNWVEQIANQMSKNYPLRTYPLVFKTTTIIHPDGQFNTHNAAVCATCQGDRFIVTHISGYRARKAEICYACGGLG